MSGRGTRLFQPTKSSASRLSKPKFLADKSQSAADKFKSDFRQGFKHKNVPFSGSDVVRASPGKKMAWGAPVSSTTVSAVPPTSPTPGQMKSVARSMAGVCFLKAR